MSSRELKFRVWDSKHKTWYSKGVAVNLDGTVYDMHSEGPDDNLIVQQYTGLKDKNGVEIYDGDIVKVWHDSYTNWIRDYHLSVVIWDWRRWGLKVSSENPIKRHTELFPVDEEYTEIVGNILENPHMVRI